MHWSLKINQETSDTIEIGYSFEENETCDGVILYHKATEDLTVEKLSANSDQSVAEKAFQFIYGLLSQNKLSPEVFHVRTG